MAVRKPGKLGHEHVPREGSECSFNPDVILPSVVVFVYSVILELEDDETEYAEEMVGRSETSQVPTLRMGKSAAEATSHRFSRR